MKRPYEIQHGNNAPVHAPLIPSPFVPYHCSDNRTATVYVEVEPEVIKKYLEPTPFEYVRQYNNDLCAGLYKHRYLPVLGLWNRLYSKI